ncbi:MAG: FAD-dependent tricarballylate dehydrogenase TcuA [Gammaproteobacteria bacterium]|nr:FAD-dependent tricarballylate dehydrogenase TcuA [Gammaproteobacteria bacterium]
MSPGGEYPASCNPENYKEVDVIVVGAGNAAQCAAIAAAEAGATVAMLEAADFDQRGGNSVYTIGVYRIGYNGVEDLEKVMELSDHEKSTIDFGSYSAGDFYDALMERSNYRADADLIEMIACNSLDAAIWMREHGVRFLPALGVTSQEVDGRHKITSGLAIQMSGGGQAAVYALEDCNRKLGVQIYYETKAVDLLREQGLIRGVKAIHKGREYDLKSKAVILACGGFEASAEMRARYLEPKVDLLPVRGTRFNTGLGLKMALAAGAASSGYWSGYHSVAIDINAPTVGDMAIGDPFMRFSTLYGIMVNLDGERFHDEGRDRLVFTYCLLGKKLMDEPGMSGWQIFDQKVTSLLMNEYKWPKATKLEARTIEELAGKLEEEGVNKDNFIRTVHEYNEAVRTDIPFHPNELDGRRTEGLTINKSNWANKLDSPPYVAYGCKAAMTFTFGGVKINTNAEVEDDAGHAIPGLYATGEMVGGLYFERYMGGNGMVAGTIFGRAAGANAAAYSAGNS